MFEIDSRRWMRTPREVFVSGGNSLVFEEGQAKGFKVTARVLVRRDGAVTAEVETSDVGSLWLPGRLRKGIALATSFGKVSIVRNGPHLLRSQRRMQLESDQTTWMLSGRLRGFDFVDGAGTLAWSRSGRTELLESDLSPESLSLVGMLAYANVPAALAVIPALNRH